MRRLIVNLNKKEYKKFVKVLTTRGYKTDCQLSTGISRTTLNRMLKEKNCTEETYNKVTDYMHKASFEANPF